MAPAASTGPAVSPVVAVPIAAATIAASADSSTSAQPGTSSSPIGQLSVPPAAELGEIDQAAERIGAALDNPAKASQADAALLNTFADTLEDLNAELQGEVSLGPSVLAEPVRDGSPIDSDEELGRILDEPVPNDPVPDSDLEPVADEATVNRFADLINMKDESENDDGEALTNEDLENLGYHSRIVPVPVGPEMKSEPVANVTISESCTFSTIKIGDDGTRTVTPGIMTGPLFDDDYSTHPLSRPASSSAAASSLQAIVKTEPSTKVEFMSQGASDKVSPAQRHDIYRQTSAGGKVPRLGETIGKMKEEEELTAIELSVKPEPSPEVKEEETSAPTEFHYDSDPYKALVYGIEIDVASVRRVFEEQYTEAEMILLLATECNITIEWITDNIHTKEQCIDLFLEKVDDKVLRNFSLQVALFKEEEEDDAAAAASSSSSLDIPPDDRIKRITSPFYRKKMFHALQHNLLTSTALCKVQDKLGVQALVHVPFDLKTQVLEQIVKYQKIHPNIQPMWLDDKLPGGDQVLTFTGLFGADARGMARDVELFIRDQGGYRPPPIGSETEQERFKRQIDDLDLMVYRYANLRSFKGTKGLQPVDDAMVDIQEKSHGARKRLTRKSETIPSSEPLSKAPKKAMSNEELLAAVQTKQPTTRLARSLSLRGGVIRKPKGSVARASSSEVGFQKLRAGANEFLGKKEHHRYVPKPRVPDVKFSVPFQQLARFTLNQAKRYKEKLEENKKKPLAGVWTEAVSNRDSEDRHFIIDEENQPSMLDIMDATLK